MKYIKTLTIIALAFIFGYIFGGQFYVFSFSEKGSGVSPYFNKKTREVLSYIEKNYYGFAQKNPEEIQDKFLEALAESLGDKHTSYFNKKDALTFAESLGGDFEGIGAVIKEHPKGIQIMKVLDGSPAARAQLKTGDIITHVEKKSVVGVSADDAVEMIRGPRGSQVTLDILSPDEKTEKTISLTRDVVVVPTVEGKILTGTSIGYIEMHMFGENTVEEFLKTYKNLIGEGAKGIILDGRNNGGGYLDVAVDVLSVFVPKNTQIVETKGTNPAENLTYYTKMAPLGENVPLVMLVNNLSASATEIVAGALQDTNRALILGEKTYGKGSVQTPFVLSDGSLLKVTTAKWYTPSGRGIDEKGIEPDVVIELTDDDYKKLYDRQFEGAKTLMKNILEKNLDTQKAKEFAKTLSF